MDLPLIVNNEETLRQRIDSLEQAQSIRAQALRRNWLRSQLAATCNHSSWEQLTPAIFWCRDCGARRGQDSHTWLVPKLVQALSAVQYSE